MRKIFALMLMLAILAASSVYAASTWRNDQAVSKNFAQEVLDLVNVERRREHLKPLKLSNDLNHYAQIRAKEITKKFSHTRPSGYSCFTVIPKPYKTVGENIAAGQPSAEAVVEAWMNSPGHRENIMNPNFKELGVGYLYVEDSKYRHYWAQLFRTKWT